MASPDRPVSGLLEIEDIEGLGRIGDDLRIRMAGLCKAALPAESSDSTESSEIGTGEKNLRNSRRAVEVGLGWLMAPSFFPWW
jgi:hypothetical protein